MIDDRHLRFRELITAKDAKRPRLEIIMHLVNETSAGSVCSSHGLLGCPMSSKEIHAKIYGDHEAWAREWLAENTEWWPDTIDLPGDAEQVIRAGCPSSPMPKKAQERIQKFRDAGEIYVTHVASGVHAYRIGFASEYLLNDRRLATGPDDSETN